MSSQVYYSSLQPALDHAKRAGHTFLASVQRRQGFSFTSFSNVEAFLAFYEPALHSPDVRQTVCLKRGNHYDAKLQILLSTHYEIISSSQPSRVYFDIEFRDLQPDEVLPRVLSLVGDTLSALPSMRAAGRVVTADDFVVYTSSRIKQGSLYHSYHVNLKDVYFGKHTMGSKLIEQLIEGLTPEDRSLLHYKKPGKGELSFVLDGAVYSENRNWRLPYSYKLSASGDEDKVALKPHPPQPDADIRDALVTLPFTQVDRAIVIPVGDLSTVSTDTIDVPVKTPARSGTRKRKKMEHDDEEDEPPTLPTPPAVGSALQHLPQEIEDAKRLATAALHRLGDTTSKLRTVLHKENDKQTAIALSYNNDGEQRTCPFFQQHRMNNFCVIVDSISHDVFYKCLAKRCPGYNRKVQIAYQPASDDAFLLSSHPADITVTYHQGTDFLEPFQFAAGSRRCLVVKSGMGTGKTQALMKTLAEYRWKRILVISTRRMFGRELHVKLGDTFKYYRDVNKTSWSERDKLIIQYESLHGLRNEDGSISTYDCVVLDEIESLLCNTTSPTLVLTHKATDTLPARQVVNVLPAAEVLTALLNNKATKVIALDADISAKSLQFLKETIGADQIRLHINNNITMRRIVIFYDTQQEWVDNLLKDVKEGKNVVVVSGSAKYLRVLKKVLTEMNIEYKIYTKDDQEILNEDARDVNGKWEVRVVGFSPCITVGVDCTLKNHFHRVYVLGAHRSCTPRTLLQMCGRCRDVVTKEIHAFVPASGGKKDAGVPAQATMSDALVKISKFIPQKGKKKQQEGTFKYCSEELVRQHVMKKKHKFAWLKEMYAFNTLETMRAADFLALELQHAALDKGFAVMTSDHSRKPIESPLEIFWKSYVDGTLTEDAYVEGVSQKDLLTVIKGVQPAVFDSIMDHKTTKRYIETNKFTGSNVATVVNSIINRCRSRNNIRLSVHAHHISKKTRPRQFNFSIEAATGDN